MLNKFLAIGHLGADPELKQISEETKVANFRMAIDGGTIKGEKVSEWISCVCWNKTAENVARYLKKGSKCYIEGRLQSRKYQKDNVDHYITEIIANQVTFLDPAKRQDDQPGGVDFKRSAKPAVDEVPF